MAASAGSDGFREERRSLRDLLLPPVWVPREGRDLPAGPSSGSAGVWATAGPSGLKARVLETLRSAREMLCVSSFLLADRDVEREIVGRAEHGVRVYVLTAAAQRLRTVPTEDDEFGQKVAEEHGALLRRVAGKVLLRSGDDLHAKFVLTDPRGPDPHGMLLTANLTSEALERNPEVGVDMDREEVRRAFRLFLEGFWWQSPHELLGPGELSPARPAPSVPRPSLKGVLATTHQVRSLSEAVSRFLERAERRLVVACFGFEPGHPLVERLAAVAASGVEVQVLTRIREKRSQVEALSALVGAGATVRALDHLHAKALWSPGGGGEQGLVMTANLEKAGMDRGFELGMELSGERAHALGSILERWWEGAPWVLRVGAKVGEVEGPVRLWREGRMAHVKVVPEVAEDLGEVVVRTPGEAASARPILPHARDLGGVEIGHTQVYRWRVRVEGRRH